MDGQGKAGHVPVLLEETIEFLAVRRGGTYIDATVGLGGHSYEIAKRLGAAGHLIGLDKDPAALERARAVLGVRSSVLGESDSQSPKTYDLRPDWPTVELRHGSFADLAK